MPSEPGESSMQPVNETHVLLVKVGKDGRRLATRSVLLPKTYSMNSSTPPTDKGSLIEESSIPNSLPESQPKTMEGM